MTISLDAEQAYDSIQYPFMKKVLEISEIQGTFNIALKVLARAIRQLKDIKGKKSKYRYLQMI